MLFIIVLICVAYGSEYTAVMLQDIPVLTFSRGTYTTTRRTQSKPQLNCIGGACREAYKVNTVQCHNVGHDGVDVNWKCETQLENTLQLGKATVICEGYNSPSDPHITAGSCRLNYELQYTNSYTHTISSNDDTYSILSAVIIFVVIVLLCMYCCTIGGRPFHVIRRHEYIYPYTYNSSPGFFTGYWLGSSGRSSYNTSPSTYTRTSTTHATTQRE